MKDPKAKDSIKLRRLLYHAPYLTFALGEADLVIPDLVASLPLGLAEAEATGLGKSEGEGVIEGAITTSGEGVGSGVEVTLSLNHTK